MINHEYIITDFESDDQLNKMYEQYKAAVSLKNSIGTHYTTEAEQSKHLSVFLEKFLKKTNEPLSITCEEAERLFNTIEKLQLSIKYQIFTPYTFESFKSSILDVVNLYNVSAIGYNNYLYEFTLRVNNLTILQNDTINHTRIELPLGDFDVTFKNYNCQWSEMPSFNYLYVLKVFARARGNNNPKTIHGEVCYHPHVYRELVCQGSYKDYYAKVDLEQINIPSYMFNILKILTCYNPASLHHPGADISNWIGTKCNVCMMHIPIGKESVVCEKSKVKIHRECAVNLADKFYSPEFVKTCSSCNTDTAVYTQTGPRQVICHKCIMSSVQ